MTDKTPTTASNRLRIYAFVQFAGNNNDKCCWQEIGSAQEDADGSIELEFA